MVIFVCHQKEHAVFLVEQYQHGRLDRYDRPHVAQRALTISSRVGQLIRSLQQCRN